MILARFRHGPPPAKPASRRPRRGAKGQSLVEFALVAPVMLALMGIAIDGARLYFSYVKLESAARDAAQYVASDPAYSTSGGYYEPTDTSNNCPSFPCTAVPSTDAQTVVQNETGTTFTRQSTQTNCRIGSQTTGTRAPLVWASLSSPDPSASSGGSNKYPVAKVEVTVCIPFKFIIPWPVISEGGAWILRSDRTVSTLVGR